jgi:hypothetical protein
MPGFGKVIGQFATFVVDGPDADVTPDLKYLKGKITFTPTISRVINSEVANSQVLGSSPIVGVIDPTTGMLSTPGADGVTPSYEGVWLPATDNVMFNPSNFGYTVVYDLQAPDNRKIPFDSHTIAAPQGTASQPINLSALMPPAPEGPPISIAAAEAAAARAEAALLKAVRTINGLAPDENGNLVIVGGGDGSGTNGREVVLRNNGSYVQWQYVGDTAWKDLILLTDLKGAQGDKGDPGASVKGDPGSNGLSAYQVWLAQGNSGTEAAYLTSLKGAKGDPGASVKGDPGDPGSPGLSAYQVWLSAGNTGDMATYLAAIKGAKGDPGAASTVAGPQGSSAYQVWLAQGNTGDVATYLAALKGAKGDPGTASTVAGPQGKSAYQVWLDAGNTGTEAQYLTSLKGTKGDKGEVGASGPQGPAGNVRLLAAGVTTAPTDAVAGTILAYRA